MKKRVTLDFDEETYNKFRYHCKKHALKITTKLELLMTQEVENKPAPNYDTMMKFMKGMMESRVQPQRQMSGAIVQSAVEPQIVRSKIHETGGKSVPTLDQLRYRRGF